MREGLGDHAGCHQPRQLSEQIHSGRLKVKQSEGNGIPEKQQLEYRWLMKNVNEREQKQMIAGGKAPALFVVASMVWLVEEFVVR